MITISFIEIYMESIIDLLGDSKNIMNGASLTIREDPEKGIYVEGLIEKVMLFYIQLDFRK